MDRLVGTRDRPGRRLLVHRVVLKRRKGSSVALRFNFVLEVVNFFAEEAVCESHLFEGLLVLSELGEHGKMLLFLEGRHLGPRIEGGGDRVRVVAVLLEGALPELLHLLVV